MAATNNEVDSLGTLLIFSLEADRQLCLSQSMEKPNYELYLLLLYIGQFPRQIRRTKAMKVGLLRLWNRTVRVSNQTILLCGFTRILDLIQCLVDVVGRQPNHLLKKIDMAKE
jgi:hypothetical protein